jgi:hypothetical protein
MKTFIVAAVVTVALVALPVAPGSAKGRLVVEIGGRSPGVGQAFTVDIRTGWVVPHNDWLRLIAVAPACDWFDVVGTITGGATSARASIPRDGFEIPLTRVAPKHWHAVVRLPRAGGWRLVVPNGTHIGFMLPPPPGWMPWVRVHA